MSDFGSAFAGQVARPPEETGRVAWPQSCRRRPREPGPRTLVAIVHSGQQNAQRSPCSVEICLPACRVCATRVAFPQRASPRSRLQPLTLSTDYVTIAHSCFAFAGSYLVATVETGSVRTAAFPLLLIQCLQDGRAGRTRPRKLSLRPVRFPRRRQSSAWRSPMARTCGELRTTAGSAGIGSAGTR